MPGTAETKKSHNCAICRSKHRKRVESMLVAKVPFREITQGYGFTKTMLSKHRLAMGERLVPATAETMAERRINSQTMDLGRMIADIHHIHFGAVLEMNEIAQSVDGLRKFKYLKQVARTSEGALRAAQGSAGLRIMERYLESSQPERVDPEDVTLGKLLAYAMEPVDDRDFIEGELA